MDNLVESAVQRVREATEGDEEFVKRFGKWERPSFARRYDLEKLSSLIRWSPVEEGIFDVSLFIKRLAPEDRRIAGEIARFCSEEFEGGSTPASSWTLEQFKTKFIRRLDACGF